MKITQDTSRAIESHVKKRVCHVGSTIMEVEVAVFRYKRALTRNNESTLYILLSYGYRACKGIIILISYCL